MHGVLRMCLAVFVVSSGIFLGGCATASRLGGVSVSVTNIHPIQASLFETSAELTLRFTNEGMEPFNLNGSAHRLFLNGTYVGRAVSNETLTVPQLDTVTRTVTIHLENLTLLRKLRGLPQARGIAYKLESLLYPSDQPSARRLKTTTAGELDLSGLVDAATGVSP